MDKHMKHPRVASETNYALCLKCQVPGGELVANPTSHGKFLDSVHERAGYGDPGYLELNSRLRDVDASVLQSNGASWHRECFQETVHKLKIERAKQRFVKSSVTKDSSIVLSSPAGRPSSSHAVKSVTTPLSADMTETKPFTRSLRVSHDKMHCIFCNGDGTTVQLHEVCSFDVGKKIHDVVQNSDNNEWKVRLQAISQNDARAIDVKYHLPCYVKHVQRQQKEELTASQLDQNQRAVLADIEFFNVLHNVLQSDNIVSMDEVTASYIGLRRMHGVEGTKLIKNKHVKDLIKSHMENIEFSRPSSRKCEMVCSKLTKDVAIKKEIESRSLEQNMKNIFDCACILRKDILRGREKPWVFDGSLNSGDRDDNVPASLKALLRWILEGPSMSLTDGRADHIDRASLNIAQTIMYEVKTQRQVSHVPKNVNKFRYNKCDNEHVLAVGLKVHAYSRSKHLISYLHSLGLSVTYSRILRIETQLAQAVISRMTETGGIYIPPDLKNGIPLFFAADNIDFSEDTHDGKNTLHATVIVAFQQKQEGTSAAVTLPIVTESSSRSLKGYKDMPLQDSGIHGNPKPTQSPKYPDYSADKDMSNFNCAISGDRSWLIVRYLQRSMTEHITPVDVECDAEDESMDNTDDTSTGTGGDHPTMHSIIDPQADSQFVPTWAAYNSVITDDDRPITQIKTLPLIAAPAHEWSTLLTILKHAQHISTEVVGPNKKTIITLDMDLYMRAVKLQSLKPELTKNCILRVGEFHTVLCALRAIGSSIEGSGIDDAWVEADIYGPTTTRQILEGRHMKRAVAAHIVTLQALNDLFMDEYQSAEEHIPATWNTETELLKSACSENDSERAKQISGNVRHMASDLEEKLDQFSTKREAVSPTFKVMRMYMTVVLTLLQFIKASRQGDWILHLTALEKLCTYFFSQNRLKYAQHIPEYISKMYSLQTSDPDVWEQFCEGNFCVRKTELSFCSLGVDQALEQENKRLKVLGGLKGITQKPEALQRFFLIAPELQRLSSEAEKMAGFSPDKRTTHHEMSNKVYDRQEVKVKKLKAVLGDLNPFSYEGGDLVNVITKSVVPDSIRDDILIQENCGDDAYNEFVQKRIVGETNLWNKITKVKLQRWTSTCKKSNVMGAQKTLELKENRSLFARMAIVTRSRPDIDMEKAVGQYEFSNVARSLFAADGTLLPCNDKHKLMEELENVKVDVAEEIEPVIGEHRAIIIDAMAIVQQLGSKDTTSCTILADNINQWLEKYVHSHRSVHMVFDHYDVQMSLKQQTRERRMKSTKTSTGMSHICTDATPIRTTFRQFVASIKTKDSLTEYLCHKIMDHYKSRETEVIVSTQRGARSNHGNVEHLSSTQEEADTLLILHALHAVRTGVQVEIMSPDTDVLLLALRRYPQLGHNPVFLTGVGDKRRTVSLKPIYDGIGEHLAAALPGFHAFTGCDTTGHFAGKGKPTCWKALRKSTDNVLEAFVQLGTTDAVSPEVEIALERYVCQLYLPGTELCDISQLRWRMFKKSFAEAEKLPPTKGALAQHTKRAHYQAMVWNHDGIAKPDIPQPSQLGWTVENSIYVPVITLLPPAPKAVLELVSCKCVKDMCRTARCSCKRANVVCTEMCTCEGSDDICLNTQQPPSSESDDSDDELF